MKSRVTFCVLILAAAAGALAFRLPRLCQRPMHTDEAVQAVKTGVLAETGVYRYDPHEYHGPSLYYLTLPSLWISSHGSFTKSDEGAYRIVPVLFGVGLVLLLLLIGDGLGWPAAVCAGVLTAVSPAMVFFSRFYIQEMLLVFFTFAAIVAGWRYAQNRRMGWALLCGAALGLMHATKETCVVAYGSMAAALAVTTVWDYWRRAPERGVRQFFNARHIAAAAAVGCALSILFFSSFVTNLSGPLDSVRAYLGYLNRGAGASPHMYSWYYYLKMLIYTKDAPGPWWSEGFILGLAVVGFVAVTKGSKAVEGAPRSNNSAASQQGRCAGLERGAPSFLRFLAVYTGLMTVAYSIIPYKTPWCMLSFLHGMILLAGVGAAAIVKMLPNVPAKVIACALLVAGGVQLGAQAYRASLQFYADNRNPYAYAQSVEDILDLAKRVEDIAATHPDRHNMLITVIAPGADYWPLPWYLRRFGRVGYWDKVPEKPDAPVIIASPEVQPALDKKLDLGAYIVSCYGLRSHVVLLLYVQNDAWQAFMHAADGGARGPRTVPLSRDIEAREPAATRQSRVIEPRSKPANP